MRIRRLDRRHILAKRYKTILCSTYEQQGSCPYGHDCLFAHHPSELRTEELNIAEGVTGELIAQWVAEKKRDSSDCSLPMSNRSDSGSASSDCFTASLFLEKPSNADARRAIRQLWRGANKHLVEPPKPHSRRRARHRAVVAAPTRNPYLMDADECLLVLDHDDE